MTIAQSEASIRGSFRTLFGASSLVGLDESRLLARFLDDRDEAAFAVLVARLGPMVLGVCRRSLDDPTDIEDAFQATFLVLVRKAGSLRDPGRLAPWLYGVARRVALRARAVRGRQRRVERGGAGALAVAVEPGREREDRHELRGVLDDELARLPERLRSAVILCDLQGLPQQEVARRLGCPVGTVKSRLNRARDRLKGRLLRRGVAPAALLGGVIVLPEAAPAATMARLQALTLRLATSLATGTLARTPAVVLMEGVLRSLAMTVIHTTAAGMLLLGLTMAGTIPMVAGLVPPTAATEAPAVQDEAAAARAIAAAVAPDDEPEPAEPAPLPPAVLEALKRRFPNAEIRVTTIEEADGETTFEVVLVEDDREIGVTLGPDGTIVEIERGIDVQELPAPVVDALRDKFPGASIESARAVEDTEENETYFVVVLGLQDREIRATIEADGAIDGYRKGIDPAELPQAVADAVRAKYPQAEIGEAAEILDDEAITFEVEIVVGEAGRSLTIAERGEIVEDQEMEEAAEHEEAGWTTTFVVEEAELSPTGRNPFFILEPGYVLSYEGTDDDQPATLTITVLDETREIGGVTTRVVEERETKGGEIVEVSRNFYAICPRTNNVYYFGEEVDVYEEGQVASHEGAWLHGEDGATFGLAMPGSPLLGARYYQEHAPGKAMDRAEIAGMGDEIETPAGSFRNVLRIDVSTNMESGDAGTRFYAAGVGLLKDGELSLVKYGKSEPPKRAVRAAKSRKK